MFDYDEETVALVWSFKDNFKDDPYIIRYHNKKWSCTCPHHIFRKATCKHIIHVRSKDIDEDKVKLTDFGRKLLSK